jgi:large subunit ribosomal protein L10
MAKALKHMLASQLEAKLQDSPSGLLVVDPGGMTVESVMAFRRDLRENAGGARLRIIHNRTARVALKSMAYTDTQDAIDEALAGPSAIIYGGDGPISIAKVVRDWRKKEKQLAVKAAVADGEVLGGEDARNLADMPDLEQLKGMLAGLLLSSGRGIAASLAGVYGGIARVMQARLDAGGFAAGAAEAAPATEAPSSAETAPEAAPEGAAETDHEAPESGGEEAKGAE